MATVRPSTATFNILFVCTGNTCRSPMAEAVTRAELGRRGWRHVEVASAGVAALDGAYASEAAIRATGKQGIDLRGHRSRSLSPELLDWADLILAMSPSHLARVERMGAADKGALLSEFASGDPRSAGVSDPFGGDDAVYDRTLAELRTLVASALDRLAPILAP